MGSLQQGAAKDVGGKIGGLYIVQGQGVPVCYNRVAGVAACQVQVYVLKGHIGAQQNAGWQHPDAVPLSVDGDFFINDPG